MTLPNAHFVSSETECMVDGSIPVYAPDDVFDYTLMDLDDIIPSNPTTSEFPMNEELTNLVEIDTAAVSSRTVQREGVSAMNENKVKFSSKIASHELVSS